MPTNVRDPRSIITPHAFGVSKALLGTPLAGPWRRFWALLVDLVVVGLLTVFLDSIQLLVWGVVALFFIRVAFVRKGRQEQAVAVLLRASAGCLGVVILLAVIVAWLVGRSGSEGARTPPVSGVPGISGVDGVDGVDGDAGGVDDWVRGLAGLALARGMAGAGTEEEARTAARTIVQEHRRILGTSLDDEELLELLEELTPEDAPWADRDTEIYREVIAARRSEVAAGEQPAGDTASPGVPEQDRAEVDAVFAEVEGLSVGEALSALAAMTEGGAPPDTGLAGVRADALRRRLTGVVSGDTLALLEDSLQAVSGRATRLGRDLRDTREALAEEESSFTNLLRDVWEQLGSAIGLWSIYFTVLLTLWNGRTVGKRLMGVRVVRLDAEPMSWWYAFERAGGYVAGLATGLLGFVQVFWDPNRQCIHDKIVGTVVVVDGAEPLPGTWREASGLIEEEEELHP